MVNRARSPVLGPPTTSVFCHGAVEVQGRWAGHNPSLISSCIAASAILFAEPGLSPDARRRRRVLALRKDLSEISMALSGDTEDEMKIAKEIATTKASRDALVTNSAKWRQQLRR